MHEAERAVAWVFDIHLTESPYFRVEARERERRGHGALLDFPSRIVFFDVTCTFSFDVLDKTHGPRAHVAQLRFEATRRIGPRSLPIDGCDSGID